MGAVKKVFKSVGGLFGLGGSDTGSIQQVKPYSLTCLSA